MVEASGGEGIGVSKILSKKRLRVPICFRRKSPCDGGKRESKKRSLTLLDSDLLDCPICCEALTVPIFQCDNGHLACSSCCPKLNDKCPSCHSHIGHNRCRAMENVLESISSPCLNAKLGCPMSVSYGKESSHEKECNFSPCSCPVQGCNYTGSYIDLYNHCDYFVHLNHSHIPTNDYPLMFRCGLSFDAPIFASDKIVMLREYEMRLLFAMQFFTEPFGRYVTISCIAPCTPEVGEFSYHLSCTVDGHTMTYQSPKMKNVLKVNLEIPHENSMLVPNHFLHGVELEMKIFIKKSNQK